MAFHKNSLFYHKGRTGCFYYPILILTSIRLAAFSKIFMRAYRNRDNYLSLIHIFSALAVDGKRLCEAGLTPGKEIGRILEQLLDWVMLDPARNQTDLLLEYAKKLRQTP